MSRWVYIFFIIPLMIGGLVIFGWYIDSQTLVQIHPSFVPMQYNTALCFTLVSVAALSAVIARKRLALTFSAGAFAISFLTLLQYITGADFQIDELFMEHHITVKTSHPGRMAPNTGLCFVLTSISIVFLCRRKLKAGGIICGISLALSTVAFGGYVTGIEFAKGWGGEMTRMALHTSLCFITVISGLLYACWKWSRVELYMPEWVPHLILMFGLISTLIIWQALVGQQRMLINNELSFKLEVLKRDASYLFKDRIKTIHRMAVRSKNNEDWLKDAVIYLKDYSTLLKVEQISEKTSHLQVDKQLQISRKAEPHTFPAAWEPGSTFVKPQVDTDKALLKVYSPLPAGGFLLATFDLEQFLKEMHSDSSEKDQIYLSLSHKGGWLKFPGDWSSEYISQSNLRLMNSNIILKAGASSLFIKSRKLFVSHIVLILGIILSIAVSILVRIWEGLGDKNLQLEKLISQLSESNTELERFAYIASHDLQEPLRMVINFNKLLKDEYFDQLDEDGRTYINFSYDAANRMSKLISGILEYSRASKGESLQKEKVDLNKVLSDVEENLQEVIKLSGTKLKKGWLPVVETSDIHAVQVFQNILTNAIKYQKEDNKPVISIKSIEEAEYWLVSIADNGIGIEKKHLETIFAPFKRLHSNSQYTGSGIGLSICKKIMENQGGELNVSSQPGRGSVFSLKFMKS